MLPISKAYGMSSVFSVDVEVQRSSVGSIGEVIDLPDEMSNHLAIVLINDGWEM